MRLFYDEKGHIVGAVQGATPEIEALTGMPSNAIGEIVPDDNLMARLDDPTDKLRPTHLAVIDGKVVIKPGIS